MEYLSNLYNYYNDYNGSEIQRNYDSLFILSNKEISYLEKLTETFNSNSIVDIDNDQIQLEKPLKNEMIHSVISFRKYFQTNINDLNNIIDTILDSTESSFLTRLQINIVITINVFMKEIINKPMGYDSGVESEYSDVESDID